MFNISSFLDKTKKTIDFSDDQKNQIIEIIEKKTLIKLGKEQVEIKNYKIFVKGSPGVLNKIFIYKEDLLKQINLETNKIFVSIE